MKDLFSRGAAAYKAFRPVYPEVLYTHILSFVKGKEKVWDCATGNGQAAAALSSYFGQVEATDISEAQLAQAVQKPNITYSICSAENPPFADDSFDLITVAQAYHWLDGDAFCAAARRVGKPGAIIAIWMYDRFTTGNKELNSLMDHFYFSIVGPYWDAGRKHIDDHYIRLPFPFSKLPVQPFYIDAQWTQQQLLGYLSSWSAVQQYIKTNGASPIGTIQDAVARLLPEGATIRVQFPIYLLFGRNDK